MTRDRISNPSARRERAGGRMPATGSLLHPAARRAADLRTTGPGATCWCGCGQAIPAGRRADARFVDGTHSKRFRRAEKRLVADRSSVGHLDADYWTRRRAEKRRAEREVDLGYDPALLVCLETDGNGQPLGHQAKKARRESWEELARIARKETEGALLLPHEHFTRRRDTGSPSRPRLILVPDVRSSIASVVEKLPKVESPYWAFARDPRAAAVHTSALAVAA